MEGESLTADWIILTMGDRPKQLADAVASIRGSQCDSDGDILVVFNGTAPVELEGVRTLHLDSNLGIPGGRHAAMLETSADIVFFLDDDARVQGSWPPEALRMFAQNPHLAVISARIVDEDGETSRRHNPRVGRRGQNISGQAPTFLGGAAAIRRQAYSAAGGYWPQIWYGHEELDLSWRLIERGWHIHYEPKFVINHPRTEVSRHATGWWHSGRNRVWIAKRNLPVAVAAMHVLFWLALGSWRAPAGHCRHSFMKGWWAGWRDTNWGSATRQPIAWKTVVQLARIGRPPIV